MTSQLVLSQELTEWVWESRGITFSSIDDMQIIKNESETFEAYNNYMTIYYKAMDFNIKSLDELKNELKDVAVSVGFNKNAEVVSLNNPNLNGYYIIDEIDSENYLVFSLANPDNNVIVKGIIIYEKDWERTAIELARNFYID